MYCLYDYKQTDLYHGINRTDEYYQTVKNLKLPLHQRKRQWPTIEEFWTSTEPKPFKLSADDQADWRKFRKWLSLRLRELTPQTKSFYEINNPKYVDEVNMSHGIWDQKAVFCQDAIAFNYDFTYHMSEAELKAYKGPMPEKFEVPKQFDLQKATRVKLDKDAIKLAQMEQEAAAQEAAALNKEM